MREIMIKNKKGYLGKYNSVLKVGENQSMVFKETDVGPWWMNVNERTKRKYDNTIGEVRERKYNKRESISFLSNTGYDVPACTNVKNVMQKCVDRNIQLKAPPEPIIQERWYGKAKGLSQILWERGFINESEKYTVNTEKDQNDVLNYEISLKYLLGNCVDFSNEESLLQSNARKIGVSIERTPTCHAELAGEGIEYTWGFGKNFYCRQPLNLK